MAEKPENEADPVVSSSQPSPKPGGQQGPAEAPKPEKDTKERESFWRRATGEPVVLFTLCLVVAIFLLLFVYAVQFRFLSRADILRKKLLKPPKNPPKSPRDPPKPPGNPPKSPRKPCLLLNGLGFPSMQ